MVRLKMIGTSLQVRIHFLHFFILVGLKGKGKERVSKAINTAEVAY